MPISNPHVELARRLWDATALGDADALLRIYAPDVVMQVRGRNPMSGEYKGSTAVLEQLAYTAEIVDEFCSDLLEIYGGRNGALIRYRVRATRGEHQLDGEFHLSFRAAGGRIYEVEIVPGDQERTNVFWHHVHAS